jgi:hypothetical protein
MCIGVIGLKAFLSDVIGIAPADPTLGKKAMLVYGRLLDVIFKLDHIGADETGKEFLNIHELGTDKRLGEKYEVIRAIWSDMVDPLEMQQKDWNSVVDAIQKDLTSLLNDYKFKRLVKQIEAEYPDSTMFSIEQLYFVDRFKFD